MPAELRETFRAEEERLRRADNDARASRIAAGMGFWRLVFVVAFGVLIARAIGWGALWIIGSLR